MNPHRFDDGCVLVFGSDSAPAASGGNPLENADAELIREILAGCEGNKSVAAQQLGMFWGTLYKWLRRYKVDQ